MGNYKRFISLLTVAAVSIGTVPSFVAAAPEFIPVDEDLFGKYIIDDGDFGFKSRGNWTRVPLTGYNGDFMFTEQIPVEIGYEDVPTTHPVSGPVEVPNESISLPNPEPIPDPGPLPFPNPRFSAYASWNFQNVPAGRYAVYATWPSFKSLARKATFSVSSCYNGNGDIIHMGNEAEATEIINDDIGVIHPCYAKFTTVNQAKKPKGKKYAGVKWKKLTEMDIRGNASVSLSSSTYGPVIADAVRIERIKVIEEGADLSIEKLVVPTMVHYGEADSIPLLHDKVVRYELIATNNGPAIADSIVFTDQIPDGLTFLPERSSRSCRETRHGSVECRVRETLFPILPLDSYETQQQDSHETKEEDMIIRPTNSTSVSLAFSVDTGCREAIVNTAFVHSTTSRDPNDRNNKDSAEIAYMCYDDPPPPVEEVFNPSPEDYAEPIEPVAETFPVLIINDELREDIYKGTEEDEEDAFGSDDQ